MHKDRSSRNLWKKDTSIRCLEKMVHQVCHSNQQLEAWENSGDPRRGFFHVFFPPEILAPHVLFQADSYFWTVYPIVA